MTEKEGILVWEIDVGRDPVSPVPVHAGIVPFPENHVEAGIVPILESRIDAGIVHVHADMLTKVPTPQRSESPTTLLWML